MAEMSEIKDRIDGLREKFRSEHNPEVDKSFLKGRLSAYEKLITEMNLDGM